MACNCKKKMVLEDTYGIREEETVFGKINRYVWKVIMLVILLAMALILVPILVLSIVYQMVFKKQIKITLPKFLGKYMK